MTLPLLKRATRTEHRPASGVVPRRGAKAGPAGVDVTYTPRLVEFLRAWDGAGGSYGNVYRKLHPVRTVVDFIADAVSSTSLKVYRRVDMGRPEARLHPLSLTLRHPNPGLSQRALIAGTVKDLAVYGNAYWHKIRSGERIYLIPLPPFRVNPRGGGLTGPASYDVWGVAYDTAGTGATPRNLPAADVVHFRSYDPEDRRVGCSKLEALRSVLAEEIEASRNREGFWQNAARADLYVTRPVDAPEWSDEARERFRKDWQAQFSGSRSAGRTAFLEDGMAPTSVSFSPKESEFIDGRKFILEATARVYNVPVSLLGLTETSTYASQKEFHRQLYQDTLPPWYQAIESEIMLQLLPEFDLALEPNVYVEFNVESKLRGSFEEQMQIFKDAVGRPWMEVAEARNLLNLPDRGDETDAELAVPVNNVMLGAPSSSPAAMPTAPPPAELAAGTPLRAASALPPADRVLALKAVLDRQVHAALSRAAAGEAFDVDRWHAALTAAAAELQEATR